MKTKAKAKARRLTTGKSRRTVMGLTRLDVTQALGRVEAPGSTGQAARLVSIADSGQVMAALDARPGAVIPVRIGMPLDRAALAALIERKQRVLLLSIAGDDVPWLVSVERDLRADAPAPVQVTAVVDGKRVELRGEEEIVLTCGEASITLRRNGRIVVRGTYVETRSKGVNRIKGGSVQIN